MGFPVRSVPHTRVTDSPSNTATLSEPGGMVSPAPTAHTTTERDTHTAQDVHSTASHSGIIYLLGIRIYAGASRSYHRLGYNNNDCPSAGSAHAALVFWPDGPVVDPGLLA